VPVQHTRDFRARQVLQATEIRRLLLLVCSESLVLASMVVDGRLFPRGITRNEVAADDNADVSDGVGSRTSVEGGVVGNVVM
jgi:hypothetical protein